jgi:hypothetical protein
VHRESSGKAPLRWPAAEQPLLGGTANRGLVFRVGDTVRRPLRPTSPATHALLAHLSHVGFPGAPRFLGIDEQGREVLSYVPGEAVTAPYPPWALTDAALASVADLLRSFHQAVASFDPTGHGWPRPVPAPFGGGLVSHNDPNLDNIVFRGGRAVALIDFDLAGPGSAAWDVAAAARLWAPLRTDRDIADPRRGRALHRFRTFVDAYGLAEADRELVADAVLHNHDWCYDVVRDGVRAGHAGFADYWTDAAERARRTRDWYLHHGHLLRAALLD